MAERLYALGDLDGAIREQERAQAALPERYEIPLNLALYWSERGGPSDIARAERLLRELAARRAGEPVVWFDLGVVLEQAGKLEEAIAAWREALRLDPRFEPARSRLHSHGQPDPDRAGRSRGQ
jgi:Flp pilus assembly protein TadD